MKPRYNRDGWPLCACAVCGALRYIEPHGTTATCDSRTCAGKSTEHTPVEHDHDRR